MAEKKKTKRGGSHGVFARREGAKLWISGNVRKAAFDAARVRLGRLCRGTLGRSLPITKMDVVEYLMMGEDATRIELMDRAAAERAQP